jgi:hypothetical protein
MTGDELTPEEQFTLGACRANVWLQERAIARGYDAGWNRGVWLKKKLQLQADYQKERE